MQSVNLNNTSSHTLSKKNVGFNIVSMHVYLLWHDIRTRRNYEGKYKI